MIGCSPFSEEFEDNLETLRLELLLGGAEAETDLDLAQSTMDFFGPLEQSRGGKIKAGSLTDSRREMFLDVAKLKAPYADWSSWEKKEQQVVIQDEEESRKQFLQDYNKWVNTGSPPVASELQYSNPNGS